MPDKIVDAIADGEVIASYPISFNNLSGPTTAADFIELAKACHAEDGLSPSLIDAWIVREPGTT